MVDHSTNLFKRFQSISVKYQYSKCGGYYFSHLGEGENQCGSEIVDENELPKTSKYCKF